MRELFPDFQLVNTTVICEAADRTVVVAEYEFTNRSTNTGRHIRIVALYAQEAEAITLVHCQATEISAGVSAEQKEKL